MTDVTYASIKHHQDALLRKSLDGGVHIGPSSTVAPTNATLFDPTTGSLLALPTGFADMGYIDAAGATFSRKVTATDISGWQSVTPLRTDITQDEVTLKFSCLETNAQTIALMASVQASAITTTPGVGGSIEIDKPAIPQVNYHRVIAFGVDQAGAGDIIYARFLPRALVTDYDDMVLANGSDPIAYGFTMTAYLDDTLGYSEAVFYGGTGWLALLTAAGFTAG